MIETHPLAETIPEMSPTEYAQLVEDIRENGLLEPITLYEGKILDGRHRAKACDELGVDVTTATFSGDDPARYVMSKNVARRHLSLTQKVLIAHKLLPYYQERAKERQREAGQSFGNHPLSAESHQPALEKGRAAEHAAAAVGVHPRMVAKFTRVVDNAPDLEERVRKEEMTISAAEDVVRDRIAKPSRVTVAEHQETIARMGREGHAPSAIAKAVGIGTDRVRLELRERGITSTMEVLNNTRHVDPNRVMEGIVNTAHISPSLVDILEESWSALDPQKLPEWSQILSTSIQSLRRVHAVVKRAMQ